MVAHWPETGNVPQGTGESGHSTVQGYASQSEYLPDNDGPI